MSEYYEFEQILGNLDEEMMLMFAGIIGLVALVVLLVTVVGYIFQSIGLYTIAKRRGIANPWLAWLPWVGYYWIAGSVSDQYQYVTTGAVNNKRKILLVLSVAGIVISSLISTLATGSFVLTTNQVTAEQIAGLGLAGSFLNMVQWGVNIATLVFWHWSLYELYSSCNPKNNVLFLVLGIIFGFLVPFFIFACRNKDDGMPPRREEPRYEYQPNSESRIYQDPWENV